MGLEDILVAIRADTEAEMADVRARAREEVFAIEELARIEGEKEATVILLAAEVATRHETDQIVIHARGAVERRLSVAVEEVYQETLARLREELVELRGTPRYEAVLGILLDEALGRLPEATVVSVDPADASLVEKLLEEGMRLAPRVDASVSSIGGVTVATDDGRTVHNTFEVRIRRANGLLRAIAGRHLEIAGRSR